MGERIGLTDEEWALIGPLLPAEHGRGCRPAQDNRRYFEGMMWLARTGAQWRHLPDDYGKWNSVFRRYRRWLEVGVFDAMLESLAEMVERDPSADMIEPIPVDQSDSENEPEQSASIGMPAPGFEDVDEMIVLDGAVDSDDEGHDGPIGAPITKGSSARA